MSRRPKGVLLVLDAKLTFESWKQISDKYPHHVTITVSRGDKQQTFVTDSEVRAWNFITYYRPSSANISPPDEKLIAESEQDIEEAKQRCLASF